MVNDVILSTWLFLLSTAMNLKLHCTYLMQFHLIFNCAFQTKLNLFKWPKRYLSIFPNWDQNRYQAPVREKLPESTLIEPKSVFSNEQPTSERLATTHPGYVCWEIRKWILWSMRKRILQGSFGWLYSPCRLLRVVASLFQRNTRPASWSF